MHLNNVNLIGRISKSGPKLNYASSGAPTCSFTLEVDEVAKSGDIFVLYLPIELWGHAEAAAETLEPGDEVLLSGRLKYKSVVDPKTQAKVSKLIISSWGISQRIPAPVKSSPQEPSFAQGEGVDQGGEIVNAPGGDEERPLPKKRARYPKALQQPWVGKKSALTSDFRSDN